jgi:hypothetical protein
VSQCWCCIAFIISQCKGLYVLSCHLSLPNFSIILTLLLWTVPRLTTGDAIGWVYWLMYSMLIWLNIHHFSWGVAMPCVVGTRLLLNMRERCYKDVTTAMSMSNLEYAPEMQPWAIYLPMIHIGVALYFLCMYVLWALDLWPQSGSMHWGLQLCSLMQCYCKYHGYLLVAMDIHMCSNPLGNAARYIGICTCRAHIQPLHNGGPM